VRFLDEFRDPALAGRLLAEIRRVANRPWTIMEVCGGQTHSLLRHGIEEALTGVVELIHGPGCPVCVTPQEAIDFARWLVLERNVVLASFGDMLRVPGSTGSLLDASADGGAVRPFYSPLDAVALAERMPERQVVFFAVGFETTTPATALAVLQAARRKLTNFSLLVAHVRVQPAMEAILREPDCRVQGFLAAGHVCTVAGHESYQPLVEAYRVPVVVTGFEPVDLLRGILDCVRQLESGAPAVTNEYTRSVRAEGNWAAQRIVDQVYEVCDRPWRGLGIVKCGGLRLREQWAAFDAERRFPALPAGVCPPSDCRSGDVLSGRIKPPACPHFGVSCTPENPLGAPMVSSEGACAAYFRYRRVATLQPEATRR
jgi:hydrogenase expression/formation protein HypD